MKVPLEILIVMILAYIGWGQSFEEQVSRVSGRPISTHTVQHKKRLREAVKAPVQMAPAPTPVDNSWMFGRTALDRPQ